MFEIYLVTWAAVALAQASPGPNSLAVISAALGQNRRSAFFVVFGVAAGMIVWTTALGVGLATLLALFPSLILVMQFVGGFYLLYMAGRAIISAWRGSDTSISTKSKSISNLANFRHGLLVVLTNPKAALMWAAVGSYLFGSGLNGLQVMIIGPLAAISATIIYGTWAWLFSAGIAATIYKKFSRWIEFAFGAVFGLLGGALLWNGIREAGAK